MAASCRNKAERFALELLPCCCLEITLFRGYQNSFEFSYAQRDYNVYILSSFLLLWNDLVKNQWSFYYQSLTLVSVRHTHTWCTVPTWSWTQLQRQLEIFQCNTSHETCQTWNPWWECVSSGMSCEASQKVSDRHLPASLPGCPSIHPVTPHTQGPFCCLQGACCELLSVRFSCVNSPATPTLLTGSCPFLKDNHIRQSPKWKEMAMLVSTSRCIS